METPSQKKQTPSFGNSFSQGWKTMENYFLVLLLVVIVVGIITGPTQIFRVNLDPSHHNNWNWNWDWGWNSQLPQIGMLALGIFTAILGLLALAYSLLIIPVFKYGGKMMFLQAIRGIRPDFNMLVQGFRENYLNIVLASLLTVALVMLGFIALFIPGIIIACRLAFVGYLVMDKKLDPIMAVEESWRMTKGYGWTIFSMGIVSFFIAIAGLCLLFVGILPACIWISSSFASLYDSVLQERTEVKPEVAAAA